MRRLPPWSEQSLPSLRQTDRSRQAFKRNDLRNWVPRSPVLLCGGHLDPTVFFFNAEIEEAYWKNAKVAAGLTSVLDVDSAPGAAAEPDSQPGPSQRSARGTRHPG